MLSGRLQETLKAVSNCFTLHTVYLAIVLAVFLPLSLAYGRMLRLVKPQSPIPSR